MEYDEQSKPNFIKPENHDFHRFQLGKSGNNPLVVICMNPSTATCEESDPTSKLIIKVMKKYKKDGWTLLNLCPVRATIKENLLNDDMKYNHSLLLENLNSIKGYLIENNIKEVWVAWGDLEGIVHLESGKYLIRQLLKELQIDAYYFGQLTKTNNPPHPLSTQNGARNYDKKSIYPL